MQQRRRMLACSTTYEQQQSEIVFKNTDRRAGVAATGWAAVILDPVLLCVNRLFASAYQMSNWGWVSRQHRVVDNLVREVVFGSGDENYPQ